MNEAMALLKEVRPEGYVQLDGISEMFFELVDCGERCGLPVLWLQADEDCGSCDGSGFHDKRESTAPEFDLGDGCTVCACMLAGHEGAQA